MSGDGGQPCAPEPTAFTPSPTEWRVMEEVLQTAAMWPFGIVAGAVGLAAALEACRTRALPDGVMRTLASVGYGIDHLPMAGAARLMMIGIRVEAIRAARSKSKNPDRSTAAIAREMGIDVREARRAIDQLRSFGWRPVLKTKRCLR